MIFPFLSCGYYIYPVNNVQKKYFQEKESGKKTLKKYKFMTSNPSNTNL